MIVRTKEAFELNYKRGKTMFAQKVVCAPPSSIAALSSRLLLSLISAGPGYHDYERMVIGE